MAIKTTISELVKLPDVTKPMITLNLNLSKLSYDEAEQLRVKNILREIKSSLGSKVEPFITEVNDLIRQQLPYAGVTMITDHDAAKIYYVTRTSIDKTDYRIGNGVDFLLLLSESPNHDYTLIELNRDSSKLFRLQNKRVSALQIKDYPVALQDALGSEISKGELNFKARGGETLYHGHGEVSQEKQIDQERYYRYLIDFLANKTSLNENFFILMGLPQNINLFQRLNERLSISAVKISQSAQKLSLAEISNLVNKKLEVYNKEYSAAAVTKNYKDNLFTDFTNIQNMLNSRDIRYLFVASRSEIDKKEPELYPKINHLIKQALLQKTAVSIVSEQPQMPLISAVAH
ncbi:hypothetical protein [Liquorilactobacillus oeni]|uniref:Bacterial archaeo-eukaryotic release factor family 6 domain-containing protein n=1 Tax=Liquorilactobacillus oeni DSM 19972 TaxID=1423777 RepID=A0A0R1MCG0_9LACO|nr:hypothetical protein [Liquorilactobacillus oeni]KRL05808.1 hypothetical protein FD46_GL000564 [Liquorilactobacillus oeni DSM 19972]